MFQAATALLLCIIGVLGIMLNTMCSFLKVGTWCFIAALHGECRTLLCSCNIAQAQVYLIFLLVSDISAHGQVLEVMWFPGTVKPVFSPPGLWSLA